MQARLLFCTLLWAGVAAAADDDPLPAGTQFKVLDITAHIANIELRVASLDGMTAGAAGHSTSVTPTVQELTASGSGISAKESAQSIVIDMSADILFDFDHAELRTTAETSLQKIAQFIAVKAKQGVLIEGHTDAKGSAEYNKKLSLARAESVHRWLVQHGGLSSVVFTTVGLGASKPVAPNTTSDGRDDPVGRQKNRRVEITIKK